MLEFPWSYCCFWKFKFTFGFWFWSLVNLPFSFTEKVISHVPAWFKLYGTSDGWKCCIGSWLEFCYACIFNGAYLGQKVNTLNQFMYERGFKIRMLFLLRINWFWETLHFYIVKSFFSWKPRKIFCKLCGMHAFSIRIMWHGRPNAPSVNFSVLCFNV